MTEDVFGIGDVPDEEKERTPTTTIAPFPNVDAAIEVYVDVRDQLRVLHKEHEAIENEMKARLDQIAMFLRDKADEMGVDSFKTQHGTAYRSLKETYRIADWDRFVDYIKRTDNFQLLEKRVAKNAAREIHKADKEVPPGLDYFTEVEFNVLRPKKKGGEE